MRPLEGLLVLDFSTLLPGPLASLLLAEAGARVIKIERPGRGDEMRSYVPKVGDDRVNFAMLNRGKQSIAIDLKAPDAVSRLMPLLIGADVVIEQFRPGVMDRLGLGYETLRQINPRVIYCAITGYGQSRPKAQVAQLLTLCRRKLEMTLRKGSRQLAGARSAALEALALTPAHCASRASVAASVAAVSARRLDRNQSFEVRSTIA